MGRTIIFNVLLFSCLYLLLWQIDSGSGSVRSRNVGSNDDISTGSPSTSMCSDLRKQGNQGVLTSTPSEGTTFRKWYFEGVDYTLHPDYIRRDRNDCSALYIWCVRRTTPLIPVCGYSILSMYYEDFYNICELELENCEYRVKAKTGVYGTDRTNDPIYHNGETYTCKYYTRRANSPEELDLLYFGGDKDKILANWQAENRAKNEILESFETQGF